MAWLNVHAVKVIATRLNQLVSHGGQPSTWKIDCDALTDDDIHVLAELIAEHMSFGIVEGVPRGGLRLAAWLQNYTTAGGPLLIVDDVLTTGGSMEQHRAGREAIGAVLFARGQCPSWVTPLFQLREAAEYVRDGVALNDIAARLDRLADSIERGASWESAGHLRNRSIYAIRSIARDVSKLTAPKDIDKTSS